MGGIVHDAHYPAYKIAGLPVVGGFDMNADRARQMAQEHGVPTLYGSLQEAFEQAPANAVFDVAVPGKAIIPILEQFPANRAVLIQKPMGDTLDEARQILKICRAKNLTAAINFQLRFAPFVIAARDLLERGLLGDLWDIEVRMQIYTPWQIWPFLVHLPRLEVLYHSIHYIDLLRSFCGDPERIYSKTLRHPIAPNSFDTRTTTIMDYGDTVRANIMTNHGHDYGPEKQQSYIKLEGSKGAVMMRAGVNMAYPKGRPDLFEYALHEGGAPPHDETKWETMAIDGSWFPHGFIGTMASLQRFVLGEAKVLPTAVEDSFKTMAVVEACYASSEFGGTFVPKS
jgi:predicted dehydrogenase